MRNPLDRMRIRGGVINNAFGRVRRNRDGSSRVHQGWDLFAPTGTTIYAVADGRVEFALTTDQGAYGKQVCISFQDPESEEPRTLYAFYGHLSQVDKITGEVTEGEVLGKTGTTGNASGMIGGNQHLHFELRTVLRPGLGLTGRLDPSYLFGDTPL